MFQVIAIGSNGIKQEHANRNIENKILRGNQLGCNCFKPRFQLVNADLKHDTRTGQAEWGIQFNDSYQPTTGIACNTNEYSFLSNY